MSKNEPMDPTTREVKNPVVATNRQRNCFALDTLVKEVRALFPEVEWEADDYDGRNVAHAVTFNPNGTDPIDGLCDLLFLVESDNRVSYVTVGGVYTHVRVEFHHSARTQDNRESFDLADAWVVMGEPDDEEQSA